MSAIVTNFDFSDPLAAKPDRGQMHTSQRVISNALAPIMFNEYERVMYNITTALGDVDFTSTIIPGPPLTVSDAVRSSFNYLNQQLITTNNNKYDKTGGAITGSVNASGTVTATQFISTISAQNTPPFVISSKFRVNMLNSQYLDGHLAGNGIPAINDEEHAYIPISNTYICEYLNSDRVDNHHAPNRNTDDLVTVNSTQILTNKFIPNLYGSSEANGDISISGTNSDANTSSYVLLQSAGGNVGIRNSAPSEALEVTGNTKTTSVIIGTAGHFQISHNVISDTLDFTYIG